MSYKIITNNDPVTLAINNAMDRLCKKCGAAILTSYLQNAISHSIWNYYNSGKMNFPFTICGPIQGNYSKSRFNVRDTGEKIVTKETKYGIVSLFIEDIPDVGPEYQKSSFYTRPFASRENISRLVKVGIFIQEKEIDPVVNGVYIFLNFRESDECPNSQGNSKAVEESVKECFLELCDYLKEIFYKSQISNFGSWLLRTTVEKFSSEVKIYNFSSDIINAERDKTYDSIAEHITLHVKPRRGKNLYCAVMEVTASGTIDLVGYSSPDHTVSRESAQKIIKNGGFSKKNDDNYIVSENDFSICEYAARSGSTIYIPNVDTYEAEYSGKEFPVFKGTPESESMCELACPVLVEGKVIAVLNIESSEADGFDSETIILLSKFANMIGLIFRQIHVYKTLMLSIKHGDLAMRETTLRGLFQFTTNFLETYGYHTAIVSSDQNYVPSGYPQIVDSRSNGFTQLVKEKCFPIAIVNIERSPQGGFHYDVLEGTMENRVLLRWEAEKLAGNLPMIGDDLKAFARKYNNMVCDLGFPFFNEHRNEQEQEKPVQGVLWFKCSRLFHMMLLDESWFLSRIARNVSKALIKIREQRMVTATDLYKRQINGAVGPKWAGRVDPEEVSFSEYIVHVRSLIVNINKFATDRTRVRDTPVLVRTIMAKVRKIVHEHNGIYSVVQGGGFSASFISNETIPDETEQSFTYMNAINCMTNIANMLEKLPEEESFSGFKTIKQEIPKSDNRPYLRSVISAGKATLGNFSDTPKQNYEFNLVGNLSDECWFDKYLLPVRFVNDYKPLSLKTVDLISNTVCNNIERLNDEWPTLSGSRSWIMLKNHPVFSSELKSDRVASVYSVSNPEQVERNLHYLALLLVDEQSV